MHFLEPQYIVHIHSQYPNRWLGLLLIAEPAIMPGLRYNGGMNTSTATSPVRYFERHAHGRLHITNRDLDALALLDELILMNTHQMRARFGMEFVKVRLKRLYHHGYVERVEAQRRIRLLKGGGSQALVLSLTNKGARLLKEHDRLQHKKRDWNERNRLLKPWSLSHPLSVSDVAVAFDMAFDRIPDHELARRLDTKPIAAPGFDTPLISDLVHELVTPDGRRSIFCHEIDCGSMPNTRHDGSDLQSLAWKFERYLAYVKSGAAERDFGTKSLRILTIVSGGEEKKRNVAQTAKAVCSGLGVDRFLVTTLENVQKQSVLKPIWINANGEVRSLL